jgi:dihydrofolate synthase / folylpolyglutamate synthase
VNGEMISEDDVVSFVKKHKEIIESIQPSFFEMTVVMAFNYFAECEVDVAVIEVGLGGRLDSTNIINPVLSVITNIGHDHMDLLGNTFEKIAVEKAGIIKKNIPVLIGETQPETKAIFIKKAEDCNSQILFADKIFSCNLEQNENLINGRRYAMTDASTGKQFEGLTILAGDYQSKNLQAVFGAFSLLRKDFKVSEENITNGIANVVKNTGLHGRWQILSTAPLTICDTGHNKEGLEYVLDQIRRTPKSVLHIILGFVNDKDLGSVLPLFPTDALYYFTKAAVPRALNEVTLKTEAARYGLNGHSFADVMSAFNSARMNARESDLIFIGGSTFVVAEVI